MANKHNHLWLTLLYVYDFNSYFLGIVSFCIDGWLTGSNTAGAIPLDLLPLAKVGFPFSLSLI